MDNLPCQFLWWTTGDAGTSNALVDVTLESSTGRRVAVKGVSTISIYRFALIDSGRLKLWETP